MLLASPSRGIKYVRENDTVRRLLVLLPPYMEHFGDKKYRDIHALQGRFQETIVPDDIWLLL